MPALQLISFALFFQSTKVVQFCEFAHLDRARLPGDCQIDHKRPGCDPIFGAIIDSKLHLPVAPNLLERNFLPEAPNQALASDIIYIARDEG